MQTELIHITQGEFFQSDNWQTTFLAYDNKKKISCFITFPNRPTSWTYHLSY